jgi:hypothetical protein
MNILLCAHSYFTLYGILTEINLHQLDSVRDFDVLR